ncbi:MAG TPA: hypothetical protein VHI71_05135 [Actinomycetota bacterium]|nr:hypothetical protein [Actinomycetota bacterium]
MTFDLDEARDFVSTHARLLDRRRFDVVTGGSDRDGILAALEAYRNDDGGYGWGLESDLRSPESQPAAALHAFEAMADAAPATSPRADELCDWLVKVTRPDGGVPFSLPVRYRAGCAPWWLDSDPGESALQITSVVAAYAHDVARHDRAVAEHEWLRRATSYCLQAIRELDAEPHAYVVLFSIRLLDRLAASDDAAVRLLEGLRAHIPRDGILPVQGGTENEVMRPLDFAPDPGTAARGLFEPGVVEQDLARLAGEQQPDGGWPYEAATFSPASALEWRGYVTVRAVSVLQRNGVAAR